MSSEQYSLAWNEFQTATSRTFQDLYSDTDLVDVTLACDDGMQVKAHQIILSSCSQFFKTILLKNPHQHPLIYVKGINHVAIQSIIRFIYLGQTEVEQESLDKFMEASKELKIKGLFEETNPESSNPQNGKQNVPPINTNKSKRKFENPPSVYSAFNQEPELTENHVLVQPFDDFGVLKYPVQDSELTSEQFPRNADGMLTCDSCYYQTINRTNFQAHRVTKHQIGRGGYICEKCNQSFSSRGSLTNHTRAIHDGVRFLCNQCDFKGTQNHTLKKHKLSFHGIKESL